MHLHRTEAYRVALILVITCGISWASTQCKHIVMDVYMKKCRFGGRAKRSLEKFDLQKFDEKYESNTKRQEQPDHYPSVNDSASHGVPQKRQLSPGLVAGDITLPIMTEAKNGVTRGVRTNIMSGTGYYTAPHPLGKRGVIPFRAPVFNDELNLDALLNDEELDELYNSIYDRTQRRSEVSKEEAWKAFLETASKCCQNVDKCLKEMNIACLPS